MKQQAKEGWSIPPVNGTRQVVLKLGPVVDLETLRKILATRGVRIR